MTSIDDPITAAEVATAIRTCPRGKASGPDGIPNNWYRDQIDVLPEILAPLFTKWHHDERLPTSFKQATVYCIPKSTSPQTGLDFRPIALLNTDYKIYARILLNRVRQFLPALVADTPFGFVPGRQVHDAIDVWTAARRLVLDDQVDRTALALMLDFSTAYDTLDRRFLRLSLQRHGFPAAFVAAVGSMHLATTATYLADGSESGTNDITTGIRQGCSLAPLTEDTTLKVAGFADDTSLFLSSPKEETYCLENLEEFGNASGLRVNLTKCRSLYLHPQGHTAQVETPQIELIASTQHLRHLGAQIASDPNRAAIWELTLQQLRARLALAQVKTMNLLQRIQISRAVILPKLLFVGRHTWPSRETIDKLQKILHNYAWHGVLTATGQPGRAWLNRDTAELGKKQGGLVLPNLLHEFELLAAKATTRWSSPVTSFAASIGAIMLWKPHRGRHYKPAINVSRQVAPAIQYADSVGATGARVIRAVTAQPRLQEEEDLISEAWHTATPKDPTELWDGEWLYIDVGNLREALTLLNDFQERTHGVFQAAGLWAAELNNTDLLIGPTGKALTRADFNGAAACGMTVGEIVDIDYYGAWRVRCRDKAGGRQLHGRKATGFALLCRAMIINYPALVPPQSPSTYLHPRPPTLDRWALERNSRGIALVWEPAEGTSLILGQVATTADAARLARAAKFGFGTFQDHPWLVVPAAIWAHPQSRVTSRHCKHQIRHSTHMRGIKIVTAKGVQSQREDPVMASALDSLSWADISRMSHGTSAQRLILLRMKHHRLGGWDWLHQKRGCPHCPREGAAASTTFHTMWSREAAGCLWDQQREAWQQWGAWGGEDDNQHFQRACVSLWLTRVQATVWDLPALRGADENDATIVQTVFDTLNELWQRQCLLTLQILWQWRCGLHDPDNKWSAVQAKALQAAGAKAAIQTMIDQQRTHKEQTLRLQLLTELSAWDPAPTPPPSQDTSGGRYVLFFDGGSRGNPGLGGSGAVIVATDATGTAAAIVWAAAMSYSQVDMTNNRAEYLGAIAGLRAAWHQKWMPLEVVGDSPLILRQLREYREPKNLQLKSLYAKARATADKLSVTRWIHHFRTHNKMADAAANIAMDARASSQVLFPTPRPAFTALQEHLAGDFQQWQVESQGWLHRQDHHLSSDSSS